MSAIDALYETAKKAIAADADAARGVGTFDRHGITRERDDTWQAYTDASDPQTVMALVDCYRASWGLSRSIRERGFTGETWKRVDAWRDLLKRTAAMEKVAA